MRVPGAVVIVTSAVAVLAALPATAQQVRIETRPPAPEFHVVAPGLHYDARRPPDADYYPGPGPSVQHDPAFIEPLAAQYSTPTGSGRIGLAGWTAANPPVGAPSVGHREVAGWFALGFSVTWDGPPPAVKRAAR